MPFWVKTRLLEPTPFVARVLLIAVGVATAWRGGYAASDALIGLAAAYGAWAVVLLAIPPFRQPRWLLVLASTLDVTAVTAFGVLIADGRFSVWVLYLFPLAAAGAAGFLSAVIASGLTLASYAVLAEAVGWSGDPAGLWPLIILAAMAVMVALLPSRWLAEWRERRAWDALDAEREATRRERALAQLGSRLLTSFEPNSIGRAAVDTVSTSLLASVGLLTDDGAEELATTESVSEDHPTSPLVISLGASYRLQVRPRQVPLQTEQRDWLQRLASLTEMALIRCRQHLDLQAEERRLRAAWASLPAPAALWGPGGELLLETTLLRELDLSVDPTGDDGTAEVTSSGDPARTFVVMRAQLPDSGCRLVLLREVTQERRELAAKDEFLSLVGHELRTPLTSIHGFSQMIDRNLTVIKQQVGQLDRLINDLATESRGQGGQLSLDLEPVDAGDLVKSAVERFRASYPDRTIEPYIEEVAPVRADPARLMQVIDNLLNNAVKYSPVDRPIRVRVEAQAGEVLLGVQDEGLGIDSEHLAHVFDRFYRVPDERTEQVKGLGLGLSIVRDLVVAHGGRVWAESPGPGRGSTFLVSLPPCSPTDMQDRKVEEVSILDGAGKA